MLLDKDEQREIHRQTELRVGYKIEPPDNLSQEQMLNYARVYNQLWEAKLNSNNGEEVAN